jgi:hypothetical protein
MRAVAKATRFVGVMVVGGAFAFVLGACVDGTTPDCSSPDAGCGPSAVEPDASADGDATTATDGDADAAGDDSSDGSGDGAGDDSGDGAADGD